MINESVSYMVKKLTDTLIESALQTDTGLTWFHIALILIGLFDLVRTLFSSL